MMIKPNERETKTLNGSEHNESNMFVQNHSVNLHFSVSLLLPSAACKCKRCPDHYISAE